MSNNTIFRAPTLHAITYCDYDNIYKVSWLINGKSTNKFSTRGKRIHQKPNDEQLAFEHAEAYKRAKIGINYLSGKINRFDAIKQLQELQFLCPKNPTAHLATLLEYALGLRNT